MIDIQKLAKRKFEIIEKQQNTTRFKKIVGRLIQCKVFQPKLGIPKNTKKIYIKDCLWAGQYEARILEVLPALIIKKPSLFVDIENCPIEIKDLIKDIRKGKSLKNFRGIPPEQYLRWIPLVGHKGREAAQLKSFRFLQEDLVVLNALTQHGYSEIGAVREGLKLLLEKSKA